MSAPEPEPVTETWTYAGIRVGAGGKRLHAWLDGEGRERLFGGSFPGAAVGSRYTARITRTPGGGVTLHGTPNYAGPSTDEDTRRELWAAHVIARTRLEMARAERGEARRNALDEALAPLIELAAPLRTTAERDALAAYVIGRLHSAWHRPGT